MMRVIERDNIRFHALKIETALMRIESSIDTGIGLQIHLCNIYTMSFCLDRKGMYLWLSSANYNLFDGKWLSFFYRAKPSEGQVRGADLFRAIATSNCHDWSHFLLGGDHELFNSINQKFPNMRIVGSDFRKFERMSHELISEIEVQIRNSNAQVIWVALGTPKQDKVIYLLSKTLPDRVLIGIGAGVGIATGLNSEAPKWMRGIGLEWLYRWLREPLRLTSRYTIGSLKFLFYLILSKDKF